MHAHTPLDLLFSKAEKIPLEHTHTQNLHTYFCKNGLKFNLSPTEMKL